MNVGPFGDRRIRLSPDQAPGLGWRVHRLGDRSVNIKPGDGPQIRVQTYGLAGDVKVVSAAS